MRFLSMSRGLTRSNVIVLACMFVCPLVLPSESAAQALAFVGAGGDKKAMYDQYMSQMKNKRSTAENRIAVRLADISLACQLDDSQRKKLEVAAKGAVNTYMKSVVKQLVRTAKQGNFDFEPDNPPIEDKVDDEENEDVVQARLINRFVVFGGPIGTKQATPIEQEKIWQTSIEKTLTLEQVEKLSAWEQERDHLNRAAAVNHLIARADLSLLLNSDQREKLKAWIDETYGEKLVANLGQNPNRPRRVVRLGNQAGGELNPLQKTKSAVAAILNESQQKIWAKSFQNELEQLNRPNPIQANGIFRFNAAPAAALNIMIDNVVEGVKEEKDK